MSVERAEMVRWIDGEPKIPSITDSDLEALLKRFTPLVERKNKLWRIEMPDVRRAAYTWDPKRTEKVRFRVVQAFDFDHLCGHPVMFKPSIAEVLAQTASLLEFGAIPKECNAFWTDIDSVLCYRSGTGHRATTHFGFI